MPFFKFKVLSDLKIFIITLCNHHPITSIEKSSCQSNGILYNPAINLILQGLWEIILIKLRRLVYSCHLILAPGAVFTLLFLTASQMLFRFVFSHQISLSLSASYIFFPSCLWSSFPSIPHSGQLRHSLSLSSYLLVCVWVNIEYWGQVWVAAGLCASDFIFVSPGCANLCCWRHSHLSLSRHFHGDLEKLLKCLYVETLPKYLCSRFRCLLSILRQNIITERTRQKKKIFTHIWIWWAELC